MGWRLKSAQFKLLSGLPGGRALYHFSQEHLTRSTTASPLRVAHKLGVGLDFWQWLRQAGRAAQLTGGRLLDFGAGWHPTLPLLWYIFGAERQTLADITPNMDAGKVNDTIRIVCDLAADPKWPGRPWVKRLPAPGAGAGRDAGAALAHLGLEYCAPYDGVLRERSEAYDLVICTQVMQHIPPPALGDVLRELHACLKPGGLFHATIHFVGQFGDPFSRRARYEHLRYGPETWERWINSRLMRFNRLKGPDYQSALEQAGFRLREFKLTEASEADLAELRRTRVHPCFQRYSERDLAALGVFLVAEKP